MMISSSTFLGRRLTISVSVDHLRPRPHTPLARQGTTNAQAPRLRHETSRQHVEFAAVGATDAELIALAKQPDLDRFRRQSQANAALIAPRMF